MKAWERKLPLLQEVGKASHKSIDGMPFLSALYGIEQPKAFEGKLLV